MDGWGAYLQDLQVTGTIQKLSITIVVFRRAGSVRCCHGDGLGAWVPKPATSCRSTGKVDEEQKSNLKLRYKCIMDKLAQFDYDPCVHPGFSEYIVNLFGILKERPQPGSEELRQLMDPENLKKMAVSTVPETDLKDVLILLKCLTQLSKEDGKPVFVW
ncbi:hypothetical protein NDU88_004869 [Pleurodeles waltl]|uniref:Speriolin C-terminal domain-containing protein n=1 Tax=Pleurodeles waltl TaxID=8319 RepID=A0AAV7V464_PLEWA|nr:hypothetical protein NDU88_004869 [Pleurodeles waltl]